MYICIGTQCSKEYAKQWRDDSIWVRVVLVKSLTVTRTTPLLHLLAAPLLLVYPLRFLSEKLNPHISAVRTVGDGNISHVYLKTHRKMTEGACAHVLSGYCEGGAEPDTICGYCMNLKPTFGLIQTHHTPPPVSHGARQCLYFSLFRWERCLHICSIVLVWVYTVYVAIIIIIISKPGRPFHSPASPHLSGGGGSSPRWNLLQH